MADYDAATAELLADNKLLRVVDADGVPVVEVVMGSSGVYNEADRFITASGRCSFR